MNQAESNASKMKQIRRWRIEIFALEVFEPLKFMNLTIHAELLPLNKQQHFTRVLEYPSTITHHSNRPITWRSITSHDRRPPISHDSRLISSIAVGLSYLMTVGLSYLMTVGLSYLMTVDLSYLIAVSLPYLIAVTW